MPDNLIARAHYELNVFERVSRQTSIQLLNLLDYIKDTIEQADESDHYDLIKAIDSIEYSLLNTEFDGSIK